MQIVHASLRAGEGEEAIKLLSALGVDIEDYKLITSPSGDLLIINLLYGNMDLLVDNLTSKFDFENDKERSLVIFTPDTVIPRDEEKLARASAHATRESLITFAQDKSQLNFNYLLLVVLSTVIISLGLLIDNVAVIVGGMVIAPVLGPILAVSIGIAIGDLVLIRKGLAAEIMALILAVMIGALIGLLIPDVEITNAIRVRMFPTLADLFIAMAAGGAGAYALIKGELESGLVGVMVAASLLPVMATIGIGISRGNPTMILGPFLLLMGNFLGLFLSNVIVFYFEGLKPQVWYTPRAKKTIRKALIILGISVILLSVPLAIITVYQFYVEKPEEIIKGVIAERLGEWDYEVDKIEITGSLINVYLYAEEAVEEEIFRAIKMEIQKRLAQEYNVNFKLIYLQEIKT